MQRRTREHTIAVIGHLVRDQIFSAQGKITDSLGGIAYSLAALAATPMRGRIIPFCHLGRDVESIFMDLFGKDSRFDFSGIRITADPGVVNKLVYSADGTREEWNSRIARPIRLDGIDRRADAVLLNFISGRDVRLPDLRNFRARYRGLIYIDYHSLSLGFGKDRRRYYRLHPWYPNYLSAANIVQMNLAELESINSMPLFGVRGVYRACAKLHKAGARVLIITAGEQGAYLSEAGKRRFYYLPAVKIDRPVDTTGCGDILGAVFLQEYLRTKDLVESLEVSNPWAAAAATFSGMSGFGRLREIVRSLGRPPRVIAIKTPLE